MREPLGGRGRRPACRASTGPISDASACWSLQAEPMGAGQLARRHRPESWSHDRAASGSTANGWGYCRGGVPLGCADQTRALWWEITPEAFGQIQAFLGPIGQEGIAQLEEYSEDHARISA